MSDELEFVVQIGDEASDAFKVIARAASNAEREFEQLQKTSTRAEREMQRAARESAREAKRSAQEKTQAEREFTNARLAMFRVRERQLAQETRDEQRAARDKERSDERVLRAQLRSMRIRERALAQEIRDEKRLGKERERLDKDRIRGLEKLQGKYSSVGGTIATAAKFAAGFALIGIAGAATAVGVVGHTAMKLESLAGAYKNLTGSQAGGLAAMNETKKISETFGIGFDDASHSMRKLMAAQFSLSESSELVKMTTDLRTVGNTAEETASVIRAMTQIKAKGVVQQEELNQLSDASVALDLVKKHLLDITGAGSLTKLESLQRSGGVSSDQGIEAIKRAVKDKTHEDFLGQRGAEFAATTMTGAIGKIGSAWDKTMNRMAESSMGSFRVINTAAERLITALDDPRTGEAMTEAFSVISSTIEDLLPSSDSLADGFVAAAQGFRTFITLGSEFLRGGMSGFLAGLGSDFESLSDTSSIEAQKEQFREFGEQVGQAAAGLTKLLGLLGEIGGALAGIAASPVAQILGATGSGIGGAVDLIRDPGKLLEGFEANRAASEAGTGPGINKNTFSWDAMFGSGVNSMEGLAAGIREGTPQVMAASQDAAGQAHEAFRNANQEHSPSRLYFDSGRNNMLGVIGGQKAENDNAVDTTRRLALDMHRAFADGLEQGTRPRVAQALDQQPTQREAQVPMLPSDRAGGAKARGFAGSPVANYMSSIASNSASTVNNFDINATIPVSGAKSPQATSGAVNGGLMDLASLALSKVA